MDKATRKLLLESYRPQRDADDPLFADALRVAASDPELAAWFEETQRFDALLSAKLQDVPVPADVKSHILLGSRVAAIADDTPALAKWRRPQIWALAALLLLSLFAWRFLAPKQRPMNALEQKAIAFTNQMPALQFVCFDPVVVAQWVNKQPGSQLVGLQLPTPGYAKPMTMIGSSVIDWNGHPVVMICLQNGQQMAMLYILKESDAVAADLNDGGTRTAQENGWVVRTTKANGQVRLLTTKGRPEDLHFPMPF